MEAVHRASNSTYPNCLDPPDWRWQAASQPQKRRRRRRMNRPDPPWLEPLHALKEIVSPCGGRRRRSAEPVSDDLLSAHSLYCTDDPKRWEVEARILAGQSDEEVALSTGTPGGIVCAYEAHFFNV